MGIGVDFGVKGIKTGLQAVLPLRVGTATLHVLNGEQFLKHTRTSGTLNACVLNEVCANTGRESKTTADAGVRVPQRLPCIECRATRL